MVTTIQLPMELKNELDSLKNDSKMSYADLLRNLVAYEKKRRTELLLEDYGEKYGSEAVDEVKEWEVTEKELEY